MSHEHTIHSWKEALEEDASQFSAMVSSLNKRVKAVDSKVSAYINFKPEDVSYNDLPDGPLKGVPISIKDNILIEDQEVTCASNILQGHVGAYDATVIQKLKEAGAFIYAQCDMDEFAFGSSSETSAYNERNDQNKKAANQSVRNPWNTDCVPGGSSGGSAACVGADTAIASLGSDTGGSIRQPAALCGVVGLKPTYGRVSRYGLVAFGSSLDQIGPFTKTVKDSALLLSVIAGHDEADSTSADVPVDDYLKDIDGDIKGIRIGVPEEYFIDGMDKEVDKAIRDSIEFYKSNGAEIVPISLPHTKYAVSVYYIIGTAEASSNLARFDGVRYGNRVDESNLIDMYLSTREQGFGDEAKRRILLGTFVLSSGYYDAYYKKAQQVRTLFKQDFEKAFEKCDVIIGATSPTPAFKVDEKVSDPVSMYLSDIFTISANLAGVPAISIPCGFSSSGLPIGMQLTGNYFKEADLFRVANFFESNTDYHKQRPSL